MKPAAWVGLVVIVGALAFGSRAFVANLTPYITFAQAREAKGQVQIVGKLDKTSVDYEQGHKTLLFTMLDDKNDRMRVAYTDVRPPNFEMATQITAIGTYDGATFRADKLLVKCPSKYQGTDQQGETKEYSAGSGLAGKGGNTTGGLLPPEAFATPAPNSARGSGDGGK